MDAAEIDLRFTYHKPKDFPNPSTGLTQPSAYDEIRKRAREYAQRLNEMLPESREKALAITHLEEVVFWANAAIARRT